MESGMPVYLEISPLHQLVTIVARGSLSTDEVRSMAQKLADARVRRFAKLVEVASASLDVAPEDIAQLAQMLRGDPDNRGPIAFVVATGRGAFARQFAAATAHEGPVEVFQSIHAARTWIAQAQLAQRDEARVAAARAAAPAVAAAAAPAVPPTPKEGDAWSDPDRQGTMIRGARQRDFTTRELVG
ncbi:hypothetical protein BH11PSE3_BH11PSE3_19190 [soil metagenome]